MIGWQQALRVVNLALIVLSVTGSAHSSDQQRDDDLDPKTAAAGWHDGSLRLGTRPLSLVDDMRDGPLKQRLAACAGMQHSPSEFSIGHRGAPRRYAEHTLESYLAAARQGAGIIECDVTFTRDRELVCRHSQCDLHTTTNILEIPELAKKCSQPFTAYDSVSGTPASARCCSSDITLAEFRMLQGKRDYANPRAASVAEYIAPRGGGAASRDYRGTLMSHADSIRLFDQLGVRMTPELKAPSVAMPYEGDFSRQDYAQKMIDEYRQAGIEPARVWPQSFDLDDLEYWIENEPEFGKQAVYLDNRVYRRPGFRATVADFERLKRRGVGIVAPPMFALLELDASGEIVPSEYAKLAKAAGLEIITWTFERTDLRDGAQANEFYYSTIAGAVDRDGDRYQVLDVLARQVGIRGIFSDWPASVTYYANCLDLR